MHKDARDAQPCHLQGTPVTALPFNAIRYDVVVASDMCLSQDRTYHWAQRWPSLSEEAESCHAACTQAHVYGLEFMQCMVPQHRAIGLQTDCMVIVLAPVVRLPDSHVYSLWP